MDAILANDPSEKQVKFVAPPSRRPVTWPLPLSHPRYTSRTPGAFLPGVFVQHAPWVNFQTIQHPRTIIDSQTDSLCHNGPSGQGQAQSASRMARLRVQSTTQLPEYVWSTSFGAIDNVQVFRSNESNKGRTMEHRSVFCSPCFPRGHVGTGQFPDPRKTFEPVTRRCRGRDSNEMQVPSTSG